MSYAPTSRAPKPDPSEASQESTGPIASDSLAAESIEAGGEFAENEGAVPLGVKGGQSTLSNTDTSGATILPPASSGAAREDKDEEGLGSDEKGAAGLKYPDAAGQPEFPGSHSTLGYAGGPSGTGASTSTSTEESYSGATGDSFADGSAESSSNMDTPDSNIKSSATDTSSGTASRPYVDSAPNYTGTVSGAFRTEGELKPKGDDLTEGGIPETKTFTGNVGGVHDPGRLAEKNFTKMGTDSNIRAGGVNYSGDNETGTGQFDVLSSEPAPDVDN